MANMYFPNVDPVYLYQRKGTADDPFLYLEETKTIQNGYTHLKEIPDFTKKVKIKDSNGVYLTEITSSEIKSNEFRVDYTTGVVLFYPLIGNKTVTVEYWGKGFIDFPAARIHIDGQTTLQELAGNINKMRTEWKTNVENYSDIATAIPFPKHGDTVQVTSNGKVYRYENDQWVNNLTVNDTAVTHLQNRIDELESHIDAGSFTDDESDGTIDGGVF